MTAVFPHARWRSGARAGLALACAAALAYWMFATAQSRRLAIVDPDASLLWRSQQAEAPLVLAAHAVEGTSPDGQADAAALARRALAAEPLSSKALDLLGLIAERRGDATAASRLMLAATRLTRRDLLAQGWLYVRYLRAGDDDAALERFDAIVRGHPETLETFTAAMPVLLASPARTAALTALLRREPPWRGLILGKLVQQWRDPAGIIDLFGRLQDVPAGLHAAELRPYLAALINDHRYAEAYAVWLRGLAPDRFAALNYLFNQDLRFGIGELPFDWMVATSPTIAASVDVRGPKRVLTVGYFGGRAPSPSVQHFLVLPPGPYRFAGLATADGLEGGRGLRWRLACLDGAAQALGESSALHGTMPWAPIVVDFDVPAQGCDTQALELGVPVHGTLDETLGGVVSFSDLAITSR